MGWLFGDSGSAKHGKPSAFGGKKPVRNPRPKGSQKGVAKRDAQKGAFNFSEGTSRTHGGRWW